MIFRLVAVTSSNTTSSKTYKSPPTYKSLLVVTTPTKVETPATFKVSVISTPEAVVSRRFTSL